MTDPIYVCERRLKDFYGGLEAKIGAPDPIIVAAMVREHTKSDDSDDLFTSGNYGVTTKPAIEWRFVYAPDRVPAEGWPSETKGGPMDDPGKRRAAMSREDLRKRIKEINARLKDAEVDDELREEDEAIGGRLYTGPMVCAPASLLLASCCQRLSIGQFVKYNSLLRGLGGPTWQDEIIKGCKGNGCALIKLSASLHHRILA